MRCGMVVGEQYLLTKIYEQRWRAVPAAPPRRAAPGKEGVNINELLYPEHNFLLPHLFSLNNPD